MFKPEDYPHTCSCGSPCFEGATKIKCTNTECQWIDSELVGPFEPQEKLVARVFKSAGCDGPGGVHVISSFEIQGTTTGRIPVTGLETDKLPCCKCGRRASVDPPEFDGDGNKYCAACFTAHIVADYQERGLVYRGEGVVVKTQPDFVKVEVPGRRTLWASSALALSVGDQVLVALNKDDGRYHVQERLGREFTPAALGMEDYERKGTIMGLPTAEEPETFLVELDGFLPPGPVKCHGFPKGNPSMGSAAFVVGTGARVLCTVNKNSGQWFIKEHLQDETVFTPRAGYRLDASAPDYSEMELRVMSKKYGTDDPHEIVKRMSQDVQRDIAGVVANQVVYEAPPWPNHEERKPRHLEGNPLIAAEMRARGRFQAAQRRADIEAHNEMVLYGSKPPKDWNEAQEMIAGAKALATGTGQPVVTAEQLRHQSWDDASYNAVIGRTAVGSSDHQPWSPQVVSDPERPVVLRIRGRDVRVPVDRHGCLNEREDNLTRLERWCTFIETAHPENSSESFTSQMGAEIDRHNRLVKFNAILDEVMAFRGASTGSWKEFGELRKEFIK